MTYARAASIATTCTPRRNTSWWMTKDPPGKHCRAFWEAEHEAGVGNGIARRDWHDAARRAGWQCGQEHRESAARDAGRAAECVAAGRRVAGRDADQEPALRRRFPPRGSDCARCAR